MPERPQDGVLVPDVALDRSSPVPLYYQVATRLQEQIESGALPVGGRLENEVELADRLGVSRPTMRKAIAYLVERGMLVRRRGVGTIERIRYAGDEPLAIMHNVVPVEVVRLDLALLQQRGLYELLRAAGHMPRIASQVVGAKAASAAEARLLGETRGAPMLTMTRTAWDESGRGVEYGSHVYPASRYSFELTLTC